MSYITIRIYIFLLIAYFKGYVEVKEKYKNFDLLLQSEFLEHESLEYDIISDSSPGLFSIRKQRKPQEKVTFYLTLEGKKVFFKINWMILFSVCTLFGFGFTVFEVILPFFS